MARPLARIAVPFAVIALLLGACASGHDADTGSPTGRWTVTAIDGAAVALPMRTTLEIEADGKVAGRGGCNSYFGSATIAGGAIAFSPLGATKMACEEPAMSQEYAYFAALDQVTTWRTDNGELMLADAAGRELVRLAPMVEGDADEGAADDGVADESASIVIDLPGVNGPVQRETAIYDCAGRPVTVEYINAGDVSLAVLEIDGGTIVASNVIAGSGARYAGRQYVWWTKGSEAQLIDYMNGGTDAAITCTAG